MMHRTEVAGKESTNIERTHAFFCNPTFIKLRAFHNNTSLPGNDNRRESDATSLIRLCRSRNSPVRLILWARQAVVAEAQNRTTQSTARRINAASRLVAHTAASFDRDVSGDGRHGVFVRVKQRRIAIAAGLDADQVVGAIEVEFRCASFACGPEDDEGVLVWHAGMSVFAVQAWEGCAAGGGLEFEGPGERYGAGADCCGCGRGRRADGLARGEDVVGRQG